MKYTTLHCDTKTLTKLEKIAKKNDRSKISQIRHWIAEEEKK